MLSMGIYLPKKFFSFFTSLFSFVKDDETVISLDIKRWRDEKRLYEAFMHSIPYQYCGWDEKGGRVLSPKFEELIDVSPVQTLEDILSVFDRKDSEKIQKNYESLVIEKKEFSLTVGLKNKTKVLKIQGRIGQNFNQKKIFYVLWFLDVTAETEKEVHMNNKMQALKISEQICQTTFQKLPYPMWIRDEALDIVWCNDAYAKAVEKESLHVVIQDQQEILDKRKALMLARKVQKENKHMSVTEFAVLNGERCYVEVTEYPLPDQNKQFGFVKNLNEIQNMKSELKRFASANTEILEQLSIPVAVFNQDMTLDFYNSAYKDLWGLSEKWLNERPKLPEILEKARENRKAPETGDFRSLVDSRKAWFTSLLEPHEEMMYLPDGRVLRILVMPYPQGGIMITYEDVTSRLELESSYNILIEVQRATIDNLAEGISVFGADGRLKLYNSAYKKIWGFTDEDLAKDPHVSTLVKMVDGYFDEEKWPDIKEKLVESCLRREEKGSRFSRSDGSIIDYSLVPLPDGALLCSYVDVTDTVHVEQALRDKNQALEDAESLKSQFLANVSYQLRTPLNAMMGFADILSEQYFGDLNEKQIEYTNGITEAGERLIKLINDILDLSTIEAGYLELDFKKVSFYEIMESIKELTQDWAGKENIKISYAYPKNIGFLKADETRLKQAILNIIQNSINFSNEGGHIEIIARRSKGYIELIIKDNGLGINEEDLKNIFQPFTRSQKTKQRRGAGIGLALVKSILDLHGGKIKIDSKTDEGTTVTCLLPVKVE